MKEKEALSSHINQLTEFVMLQYKINQAVSYKIEKQEERLREIEKYLNINNPIMQ